MLTFELIRIFGVV